MKIFKNYIIILLTLLSFNAFAIETSPYKTPESCNSVVEEGKSFAMNNGSGFNTDATLSDFISCNVEILPNSLSTEILYAIFGDNIIIPLSHIGGFVESIYTKADQTNIPELDEQETKKYLSDRIKTFPVLTATIEAVTFGSFQIIITMFSLFSLFHLFNTMQEGTFLGKNNSTIWTFVKMFGVLALIYPLDSLGLNTIQLIILFIAFCGSLLASLIWSILPLFKYVYLTEFESVDDELIASKNAKTMEMAEFMVSSSICDISARQALLLKGTPVIDFNETMLSDKEMFNCLKDTNQSNIDIKNNKPFEHNKTAICSESIGVEHIVDCGSIKYTEDHNLDLINKINNDIYPRARNIAKKSISSNCKKNYDLNKGDSSLYYTYCSDVDNISFNEDYKNEKILSTIEEVNYSEDDYEKDIKSIQEELNVSLSQNLTKSILEDKEISSVVLSKISFALNKGWLNAGTFLFDVGATTNLKDLQYEAIMLSLSYDIPTQRMPRTDVSNLSSFLYSENLNVSESAKLAAKSKSFIAKGNIRSKNSDYDVVNTFIINDDLNTIGLEEEYNKYKIKVTDYIEKVRDEGTEEKISGLTKMLFPNLVLGKLFNEPDFGAEESCSMDYSNCKRMPVNPIASIIDASRTAAGNSATITIFTGPIQYALSVIDDKADTLEKKGISNSLNASASLIGVRTAGLLIGFLNMFLAFNMLISILGGYILPIVLFIYFIGNALSWIISVVTSVAAATLWLGLHLMPTKETGFAGHAKSGYLMLMDIFLKPVFLVLGVFGAFILSTILLVVFNATFEIVMSTFTFFSAPQSVVELFYNFVLNLIYTIFLLVIFFKSAKAVYKIPNALENWIGLLSYEEANMWREVTNLIQRTFLSGIKKFLIFA